MNLTIFPRPPKRIISVPYWAIRGYMLKVRDWIGDLAKAFIMLVILGPAANYMPGSWAFSLARFFGRINALLPFYGQKSLDLIKKTLAADCREARRLTRACLSRPYLDFVAMRRIVRGRENPQEWPIVEINQDIIEQFRRSGASYIVATGHFNRKAVSTLYLSRTIPQKILTVVNSPLPKSFHPHILWSRVHFGQMLDVIKCFCPDVRFLVPGQPGLIRESARSLKGGGNALVIHVDPPWDDQQPGSFSRAFAGKESKSFASGAARLARLAQCPIFLCLPYMNDRGQIILDWVRSIPPPDPRDSDADIVNTNLLLDDIERAIGLRPDQYALGFLGERHWNPAGQHWE